MYYIKAKITDKQNQVGVCQTLSETLDLIVEIYSSHVDKLTLFELEEIDISIWKTSSTYSLYTIEKEKPNWLFKLEKFSLDDMLLDLLRKKLDEIFPKSISVN